MMFLFTNELKYQFRKRLQFILSTWPDFPISTAPIPILIPNRSLDRKRLVSVERESSLGILPTSASVLLSVLPRRSPLRLQQEEKQSTRQKQAIYPKSNDRFGFKNLKDFIPSSDSHSISFYQISADFHSQTRKNYGRPSKGIVQFFLNRLLF